MPDQDNFLPEYDGDQTPHAGRNKLNCQVRHKEVPATPEELVRQRVLHWLIDTKGWEEGQLRLEYAYPWESDPARSHIRPDIELLDSDGNVLVVVECKREEVPLSKAVDAQAIEYAVKSNASYIWVTNGGQHRFLVPDGDSAWVPASSIEPLGETYEPPTGEVAFPDVSDESDVQEYLDEHGLGALDEPDRNFTLALHHAVFEAAAHKTFPYSHQGVHILEHLGVAFHEFSNRSGGSYYTRYADFIAATRGRVEAMSVAVNSWYAGGIRLCVGVTKPERTHHALQLDVANCEWNEKKNVWRVYHDGRMSQISNRDVLEAVREANCGHWIDWDDDGKEWIYLGALPAAGANGRKPWKFLARLLHYALIRTSLREARAAKN